MTIQVNKTGTSSRPVTNNDASNKHKAKVGDTFNAAAAAQKAAAEPSVQAKSLHSQVLAEAMDGDASEAIARAAHGVGKRDGLVDEDAPRVAESVEKKSTGRRPQVTPPREPDEASKSTTQSSDKAAVARQGSTQSVGSLQGVGKKTPDMPSVAGQHDQLMLLSSTMSRRDLATYLAKKHAARLETIFRGQMWSVDRNARSNATAAQMLG
jgi:hypothetical protein